MLINCSPDRSPSRQSSSSGGLLPEMMESETPPQTPQLKKRATLKCRHEVYLRIQYHRKIILWLPDIPSIRLLRRATTRVCIVCGRTR